MVSTLLVDLATVIKEVNLNSGIEFNQAVKLTAIITIVNICNYLFVVFNFSLEALIE